MLEVIEQSSTLRYCKKMKFLTLFICLFLTASLWSKSNSLWFKLTLRLNLFEALSLFYIGTWNFSVNLEYRLSPKIYHEFMKEIRLIIRMVNFPGWRNIYFESTLLLAHLSRNSRSNCNINLIFFSKIELPQRHL